MIRNGTPKEVAAGALARAERINACLIGPGAPGSGGYRNSSVKGRRIATHRLVLEIHLGRPLEKHELALHRCNNPACINPEHLYAGSAKDNMADRIAAGQLKIGRNDGMYHVWTYDKRRRILTMLTRRVVKERAAKCDETGEWLYDETFYPAAWQSRRSAHQYGLNHYGVRNFVVMACGRNNGGKCGMADHAQ